MLKFSPEQMQLVLNERAEYNKRQTAMNDAGIPSMMGNASPVHKDVWGRWDKEGIEVQRDVLAVFNSISGLSKPLPIGVLVNNFQRISDSGSVNISLDGRSKDRADQPLIDYVGTPVPIIDSEFRFGWRQMEAERAAGFSTLDMAAANNANRRVAEKLEDLVINGDSSIVVGSSTIYGLRTVPNRNTGTHGLTLATATGAQWVDAIKNAVSKLIADNYAGGTTGVTIYLNLSDYFVAGATEFTNGYPKKILAALLEIPFVESIIPASKVPANEIIGLVRRRDVVEILSAMPQTTRPKFRANPEDDYVFTVMAAAAPQFKWDYSNQCGIVQLTQA